MCWCDPSIRGPYCGKVGCVPKRPIPKAFTLEEEYLRRKLIECSELLTKSGSKKDSKLSEQIENYLKGE